MEITHPTQIKILQALIEEITLGFSELNKQSDPEMTSDNFNFHIKELLAKGILSKDNRKYTLTNKGVEYAARIDLSANHIFKQPKTAVAIGVFKDRSQKEILLGQRKYQPLKNSWSFHTEKTRFGETYQETITRCLLNETGLTEFEFDPVGSSHMMRKDKDIYIADVIHIMFKVFPKSFDGLKFETEFIHNEWFETSDLNAISPTTPTFLKLFKKMLNNEIIVEENLELGRI